MDPQVRILVIDDEEVVRASCTRVLGDDGHLVETVVGGVEGLALIEKKPFDILIVDLKMPGMGGMEVLQRAKETHPELDVLIITGYSTVETAVQAMKLGAFDYICKPFSPDELSLVVRRVVEKRRLTTENRALQQELWTRYKLDNIVGTSRPMEEVFRRIAKVAATNTTVLVHGESGVGKELVAKAVHYNSLRKDKPFVPVDCAGIPETLLESELFGHEKGAFTGAVAAKRGLLETACGGTLFLDEISNVPPGIQANLHRDLQEREYRPIGDVRMVKTDFRLVAATNRDLEAMVKDGRFREDLYYRLNVFAVRVPPLRERKEDIPALSFHFLKAQKVKRVSAEAMSILMAYEWPGNVRQLGNVIEGAAVLCDGATIKPEHLPLELRKRSPDLEETVPTTQAQLKELKKSIRSHSIETIEKAFVIEALERNDWNVTRAAAQVGMQRTNFQTLMKKHSIRLRRPQENQDGV
ncbi:MAG: sigma-54-dependent Fis family transcriptional regulator [Planctomycetes bacterium]|nr:sigma-54-dependent Fis family transcriptional regulator [Planctomycetota bacterium]